MNFFDLLQQTFESLWMHKVRSCLALFGIVWGTVAVIVLLALANGFYQASLSSLAFLNKGTIFAWAGTTSKPFAGSPQGQRVHLQVDDLVEILQNIPGVKTFSPVLNGMADLVYQDKKITGSVSGVATGYQEVQQLEPLRGGRFLDVLDEQERKRVVFLDDNLKQTLFGKKQAVGETLLIKSIPFTVIGVAAPNDKTSIRWMQNNAYIPYTTYLATFGRQDIHLIFLIPHSPHAAAHIRYTLKMLLAMRYHFDPTDEQAIHMPDLENVQVFFQWFFRIVEIFLGFCGALTLSVGGLGVANMMFLIVVERTREIGLRMALGAEPLHIMLQFMLETFLLVGIGGIIGFILSGLALILLQHLPLPTWLGHPHTSVETFIITIGILVTVGFAAGYFPARRAANMEPVAALAHTASG